MLSKLPPPTGFGLPKKFSTWRKHQEDAILHLVDSQKRIVVQTQPTGSGKSLCYVTSAILSGRTVILTSTKGLQKQLELDFGSEPGLSIVMGKNAYKCVLLKEKTCDWGLCNFGHRCPLKKECHYYNAIERAKASQIVVTNYSFWVCNKPDTLGKFDLLVCDEAHDSVLQLCDSLSVEVYPREFQRCRLDWIQEGTAKNLWRVMLNTLEILKENLRKQLKEDNTEELLTSDVFKARRNLKVKLERLEKTSESLWVTEHLGNSIVFDPLWPGKFAEGYLFRGAPKILLTSATVTKKTVQLLNVNREDTDFIEYPSYFPVERRAVCWVPTCRVDYRMKDCDMNLWLARIDQIISQRLDRKGIVHTTSYQRCQRVINTSEYTPFMISHKSGSRDKAVREFKGSDPPCVLVSPSVITGYDFPYDECRYQIIGKVPFPDQRKLIDKKRKEIDSDFGINFAMQNLVQAVGRGMRALDDSCETFIIDDHIQWFVKKYAEFAPKSFLDAFRRVNTIPIPASYEQRR